MDNKTDIEEDIKMLKELNKLVLYFAKDEETKKYIQAIENIIAELEKKDKIIKEMINVIKHYGIDFSNICCKRFLLCNKCEKTIEECIEQYFKKKVEEKKNE